MPSVADGLGTPDPGESVNTEAGFEAALARKTGNEAMLEGREPRVSTSILDGLTTEPEGGKRDEAGRFVAAEVEEPAEETPEAEPEGDPAPAEPADEWQVRYDEAQKVIGRQGNELGQAREKLAAQDARLAALEARPATQALPALRGEELIEAADDLIVRHGEAQAAIHALNQDPSGALYEQVMSSWYAEDAKEASRFDRRKEELERQAAAPAAQAPAEDPWLAEQKGKTAIASALGTLQGESKDWDSFAPHLATALDQVPKRVAAMVASDDPEEKLDGVRLVADRARLIARSDLTAQAAEQAAAAAVVRKKAGTLPRGNQRPVAPVGTPDGEASREEAIRKFKDDLMATETTSVQAGLTYAKS